MRRTDLEHHVVHVAGSGRAGELTLPSPLRGIVAIFHEGGNRNLQAPHRRAATILHTRGLGTLVLTLAAAETRAAQRTLDVSRLAECAAAGIDWLARCDDASGQPLGLLASDMAAAAALQVAQALPARVAAVVAHAGRADLAWASLPGIDAPTLLIVGDADADLVRVNREAMRLLRCSKRLEIVPGADRRFAAPGARDAAAELTGSWMATHLAAAGALH